MGIRVVQAQDYGAPAAPGVDTGLNAQLIACWQAALHSFDPAEGARWIDMAHWLSHREETDGLVPPAGRGDPALLSLDSGILRGEVVDIATNLVVLACAGPHDLQMGQQVLLSVRGWRFDRTARVVTLEPGLVRLWLG